jgi:hypothetical protein
MSDKDNKFLGGIFDTILGNIFFLSKEEKEKILIDNHIYEKAEKIMTQIAEERIRSMEKYQTLRISTGSSWETAIIKDDVEYLTIINDSEKTGEVTDENISKISTKTNLKGIDIRIMPITDKAFKALSNLNSLETITIYNAQPMQEIFEYVSNFPNLQFMSIHNTQLIHPNLQKLQNNICLVGLALDNCFLTDTDFTNFPLLPAIQTLVLGNNDLTCTNFDFIGDIQKLENFDIRNNLRFNIDGLTTLTAFSQNSLMDIYLNGCHQIDDNCVKCFLEMKKIQVIAFTNTSITEKGLEPLKDIPSLRHLFVPDQISFEFAKELQEKYMPKCHFNWSDHTKNLHAIEWSEDYD